MIQNFRRLFFLLIIPTLMGSFLPPLFAADLTLGIHGGPMTVEKGFADFSFDTGYTMGLKAFIPMETLPRISLGVAIDYGLMDGDEGVKDAGGIYESKNDYKLADTWIFARYTLFSLGKSTFFLQAATGLFWEKTTVRITPLSPVHTSRSKENMGMMVSYGGGMTFLDHFELYAMMNRLEDNEVLTVTIGWLFR